MSLTLRFRRMVILSKEGAGGISRLWSSANIHLSKNMTIKINLPHPNGWSNDSVSSFNLVVAYDVMKAGDFEGVEFTELDNDGLFEIVGEGYYNSVQLENFLNAAKNVLTLADA